MKQRFWIFLAVLLTGCINDSEKASPGLQIEDMKSARDSLIQLNHQLQNRIDSLHNEQVFWFDNNTEGKQFLEAGIKNPKEFIVNSLKQQTKLVPAEPVLGGQMRFTRVQLLGRDCLIAYYEDGHIAGRAIYSFKFQNGNLKFSLVRKCPG